MFRLFASLALAAAVALPGAAFAHSAIFDCFDNGDGTVSCQGGYSDGSSASGVSIKIKDAKGDVLYVGKARALKQRVTNYTQVARLSKRLQRMVAQTRSKTGINELLRD